MRLDTRSLGLVFPNQPCPLLMEAAQNRTYKRIVHKHSILWRMMMPNLIKSLPALFAITLLNVFILGCAQTGAAKKSNAQSEVCRTCHVPNGASGAKDLSPIYATPKSHHPVGVSYPIGSSDNQKFKLPNRQTVDIAFFDRNGNGQPDGDEIQLFGMNGEVTVECASCHQEHGSLPVSGNVSAGFYLRVANIGSALCITCHNQ